MNWKIEIALTMYSGKEFQSLTVLIEKNLERGRQEDCGLNSLKLWPLVDKYIVGVNKWETSISIVFLIVHDCSIHM